MKLEFTLLEQAALAAIIAESDGHNHALTNLLVNAVVSDRQNSGGGFFTTILSCYDAPPLIGERHFGNRISADIDGMEYGIGLILHLEMGRPHLLEGYSQGGEDTHGLDFTRVGFRIYKAQAPLITPPPPPPAPDPASDASPD